MSDEVSPAREDRAKAVNAWFITVEMKPVAGVQNKAWHTLVVTENLVQLKTTAAGAVAIAVRNP